MLTKLIFNNVKKIIPRISQTELIALRSGTVSLDRNIFRGKLEIPEKTDNKPKFNPIINHNIKELLEEWGNQQQIYPSNNFDDILKFISKNKLFSLIIDNKWGGNYLSVEQLSSSLTKISSVNPALGVTVMVPNSLGPAELLETYGTEEQKKTYLPGLASGEFVPCFGLTGPNNGSDALGSIDTGRVVETNGKKYVKLAINKRYITLAPIANLIGLAFNLEDPDNLLNGKSGITVALLERGTCGLIQESYHNPLDVGFPNGTLKGELTIPIEQVIGGEDNVGEGWKMLMECLAAGRGVCLPATANACSKVSTLGIWHYINNRKQFNIPLIKMEAIQNKFCDMVYNTWLIQSSISLTNNLLDSGEKPAVISAIMKQQTTERAREVLNHAMDIHAGSAICLGENNFLNKFYKSAPIGITVEGSNTLTKNLIIFGQGLNKSHPYIFNVFQSIQDNDIATFRVNLRKIVNDSIEFYLKSFFSDEDVSKIGNLSHYDFYKLNIEKQINKFAILSNFVALLGGKIKSNQTISGLMADYLSNLYLANSVIYYTETENKEEYVAAYCLSRLITENTSIINEIIYNYPDDSSILSFFINRLKSQQLNRDYSLNRELIAVLDNECEVMETIKEDIILDNALINLENLTIMKNSKLENTKEYKILYDKVISVGEYSIDN